MPSPKPGLVRVCFAVAGVPAPPDALARVASLPHPFLRWAAGGPTDLARWSYLACDPDDTWTVSRLEGGGGRGGRGFWASFARRWPRRVRHAGPAIPFGGGWAGTIGYELRSAVERIPPPRRPPLGFPTLFLAHYDAVLAWDHATGQAYVSGLGRSVAAARRAGLRLLARVASPLARAPSPTGPAPGPPRRPVPVPAVPPADYRRDVSEVRRRIRRGDFFQANISQRFDAPLVGSPLDLFRRLVERSPAPFATYVDVGAGRFVLSASPERFLRLEGDRAETRPMKGTRPRGASPAEDRRLARELERSVKDGAELAMIVDLSRNDLGRVCRPGTVEVSAPRRIETYATVHQGVAIVTGRLREGATGVDLVRAAFPPGSVTGAPKVEAMRTIDDLEGEGRGPYCGAVGWLDEGGDMDLAVAIRTVAVAGRRVSWRVGGGITLLSDPEEERRETLDKGVAIVGALAPRADGASSGP